MARARSAATLVVLTVLFVIGVAWAWSAVTEPFPEMEEEPPCTETAVSAGDVVRPRDVLVSVLNASRTEGLARDTMDGLIGKGFGEGTRGNTSMKIGDAGAVVLTDGEHSPAAELVRSYLGRDARIVEEPSAEPGVTVVVGDDFAGVVKGRRGVRAKEDTFVCKPPASADAS
jgi:hypothetical protein